MSTGTGGGDLRGLTDFAPALPCDNALAKQDLHPGSGMMSTPLLTLDEGVFDANAKTFLAFAVERGLQVFPHVKTSMAPSLAHRLLMLGAKGMTVADIRQASVMLSHGVTDVIIANQIGGEAPAKRLARLLAFYPDARIVVFVDSREGLAALAAAWRTQGKLPRLGIAVEIGKGRGGVRSLAGAESLIDAVTELEGSSLYLAGLAAYEGAAAVPGTGATTAEASVAALLDLMVDCARYARGKLQSGRALMLTAGGSSYFDLVADRLQKAAAEISPAFVVLRSGALFFHDHGVYQRAMAAMARRSPGSPAHLFRPALRLWAEVLSRPEPGLAILGFGMRDASIDQGLPQPLALYRNGQIAATSVEECRIERLNDQHAFMQAKAEADIRIGDILSLGISHPCTSIDRWRMIWGLDGNGHVVAAHPTYFG